MWFLDLEFDKECFRLCRVPWYFFCYHDLFKGLSWFWFFQWGSVGLIEKWKSGPIFKKAGNNKKLTSTSKNSPQPQKTHLNLKKSAYILRVPPIYQKTNFNLKSSPPSKSTTDILKSNYERLKNRAPQISKITPKSKNGEKNNFKENKKIKNN